MKKRFLLFTGLLVLSLAGCANDNTENTENSEVSSTAIENEMLQVNRADAEWMDTKAQSTDNGVAISEEKGGTLAGEVNQEEADPEMVQSSLDALKSYFDTTVDMTEYEVSTNHYEGCEDVKANSSYFFSSPQNYGADGYWLENSVMPSYNVIFFDNGELKAIYCLGSDLLLDKKPDEPVTVEDAKRIAKEFVVSKQLIPEKEIKLLGGVVANSISISVVYEDGKDGALAVQVDIETGVVNCFDRLTRERGMKWITPIEEGSGVG